MLVCSSCGAELNPSAKFCGECGTKVDAKSKRSRAAVEDLIAVVGDWSRPIGERKRAIAELAEPGQTIAAPALIAALYSPDLCSAAADALAKTGDSSAAGPLAEVVNLRGGASRFSCERATRALVAADPAGFDAAMREHDQNLRAGAEGFVGLLTTPLEQWDVCPMCQHGFATRVEHGAYCVDCGRYFTDVDYTPSTSSDAPAPGNLTGASLGWFPRKMVEHYGFAPKAIGEHASFGVNLAWRASAAAPTDRDGVALKLDAWLMKQAADSLRERTSTPSSESTPTDKMDLPSSVATAMQRYLDVVDDVQMDELAFHEQMVAEYLKQHGRMTRRANRRISEKFEVIADRVLDLQREYHALRAACEDAGASWDDVCRHYEVAGWADVEFEGFLSITSEEDLLEVLERRGPGAGSR